MNLTQEQQAILEYEDNAFIQGPAGTGKSTLIRMLKDELRKKDKNVAILATTGIAAVNIGGITVHSAFRIPFKPHYIGEKVRTNGDLKFIDTIIIDEVSMLRADVLDYIDLSLKKLMMNNQPFGGKQILLFGDLYQLPPVVRLDKDDKNDFYDKYDTEYFFSADSFNDFTSFELTKVFRQESQEFLSKLNNLRDGNCDYNYFNSNIAWDEEVPTLASTNKEVNSYNTYFLNKIDSPEIDLKKYHYFVNNERTNNACKYYIDNIKIKIGAKVMIRVNGKRYVNGTIGKVKNFNNSHIFITTKDGDIVFPRHIYFEGLDKYGNMIGGCVPEKSFDFIQNNYTITYYECGYPLSLGWAFTIHKSQGLQFDELNLDPRSIFAPYQLYVALSRLTNKEGLNLVNNVEKRHVRIDKRVVEFVG